MKKIINYIDIKINQFVSSPKLMRIVKIIIFICLMYLLVDLYLIHLESKKVDAELEILRKFPN